MRKKIFNHMENHVIMDSEQMRMLAILHKDTSMVTFPRMAKPFVDQQIKKSGRDKMRSYKDNILITMA